MGRKSAKGKEKRKQRKEEQIRLKQSQILVDQARALKDPMAQLLPFKKYCRDGISVGLETQPVRDLDEESIKWVFDLTKRNMKELYESCDWGWNEGNKYDEMTEDEAWYLIARSDDGTPVAFSHFRFDMDYGDEVLYCYEIQLEKEVVRHGLGKFMMQILELMAFRNQMKKVILTILKHNDSAIHFFKALGYEIDETSPEDNLYEQFPYRIVSKFNPRLKRSLSNSE